MKLLTRFLIFLTLFGVCGSLPSVRGEEDRDAPRPEKIPDGLEEVRRPTLSATEKTRIRALIESLGQGRETRKKAGTELLALGWKAVPLLEETDEAVAGLLSDLTMDEDGNYGPRIIPYLRTALWLGAERTLKVLREKNRAQKEKLGLGVVTLDDAEYQLKWILE